MRETEAWALADERALRTVLGTTRTAAALGIPAQAEEIESLADPKAVLGQVVRAARPGRGRRKPSASSFLDVLGETARIDELQRLAAFRELLDDLHSSLVSLGYRNE